MRKQLKYTKLGHDQVDVEHEDIIRQINELHKLVFKRTEDETIIKLLDLLISRSVKHYHTEEVLMQELENYPDKELHVLEHRLVIQHMTHFRHKLQQELIEYQIGFKKAVQMWMEHMFKYDTGLVEKYLKETEAKKASESTPETPSEPQA